MVEDNVFEFKVGRDIKETKLVNLYICRLSKIELRGPLKEYQYWAQGNWKTSLAPDSILLVEYNIKDLENDNLNREVDENLDKKANESLWFF